MVIRNTCIFSRNNRRNKNIIIHCITVIEKQGEQHHNTDNCCRLHYFYQKLLLVDFLSQAHHSVSIFHSAPAPGARPEPEAALKELFLNGS